MSKPGPLCGQCPLNNVAGPVWGVGCAKPELIIIGQNPGPEEIQKEVPFIGPSGNILTRSMWGAGLQRDKQFITNAVKCFVAPGAHVPEEAIRYCKPLLEQELSMFPECKTILTVGVVPFKQLTGLQLVMMFQRPKSPKKLPRLDIWHRGYPFRELRPYTIIPTFHPVYAISTGFREMVAFDNDVAKAARFAHHEEVLYEEHSNYNPSSSEVVDYVHKCLDRRRFGCDIETPEKSSYEDEEEAVTEGPADIDVIGLSAEIGEAIEVRPQHFHLLEPLFDPHVSGPISDVTCYTFNGAFDLGKIASHMTIGSRLRHFDVMLGLQKYWSDARPKNLAMACSLFTEMPFHKNLYKANPPLYNSRDTYGALWAGLTLEKLLPAMGGNVMTAFYKAMSLIPVVEQMRQVGANCDVPFAERTELACNVALNQYEKWWSENIPAISWSAPQQLITLFTAQGLPIQMRKRKDKKTGRVATTPSCDQDVLELYRDKFGSKTAGLILTMRELKHASDFTHIYSSDGRAHATYKIHGQKGHRIQAIRPDMQNIPEEIAGQEPRKIVIGDQPDHVLIVADYSGLEFYLYGFAAQCKAILQAKAEMKYIYGLFYEQIFREPFFQDGMPPRKAFIRKDIPPWKLLVAKSGPLGLLYGRGVGSLLELGINKREAQSIYDTFFLYNPEIAVHHRSLLGEVDRRGYLVSYFGDPRRFPHSGALRNEILSFTGQVNGAGVLIQNALLPLHATLPDFGARLVFTVHDSVGVSCPLRNLRGCASHVQDTMEMPIPQMKGFYPPCALKVGWNWNDLQALEDFLVANQRSSR